MKSSPGQYVYTSPGLNDVCGLFIVGDVNQIVAIDFIDFNIDCDSGGLLVVGTRIGSSHHTAVVVGYAMCLCV